MGTSMIDAARLRVFLTHTGFVAVECDDPGIDDMDELFGEGGSLAPRALDGLVAEMLAMLAAAPERSDAAGLEALCRRLKSSLAQVERARAGLGLH